MAASGKNETNAVIDQNSTNTRGIPGAKFIEDVTSYVSASQLPLDALQKQLHTLYGKYKFMESQLVNQQRTLHGKIPEIKSALDALKYMIKLQEDESEGVAMHFELSDALYANAVVKPQNTVMLWLGANVMLSYTYDEAEQLLVKNLKNATASLESLEMDIEYLKDQITISEVNIARLHNYGIAQKQQITGNKPQAQQQQQLPASTSSSTQRAAGTINAAGSKPASSNRSFAAAASG